MYGKQKSHHLICIIGLALLLGLSGCAQTTSLIPAAPTNPLPAVTFTQYPAPLPTQTSTLSPSPTHTPKAKTPTSTPIPQTSTVAPLPAIQSKETITAGQSLHNVILFTSKQNQPFFFAPASENWEVSDTPHLWAISPDGLRSGRLTGDRQSASLFTAPGKTPILLSPLALQVDADIIQTIPLPIDCAYPSGLENASNLQSWIPCQYFLWSVDGRWVQMAWQEESCVRGILIIDTQTQKVVYKKDASHGGYPQSPFLSNDQLVLFRGHCQGGGLFLIDLQSGSEKNLGDWGDLQNNADWSALATTNSSFDGVESSIWVYNRLLDKTFAPPPTGSQTHILWAPDGKHLLYLSRSQARSANDTYGVDIKTASQVMILDSATGEQRMLAGDPAFDYFLCAGYTSGCDFWQGDWIQVRRLPFAPQSVRLSQSLLEFECLVAGSQCPQSPELLGLNWRSGELLPWDEAQKIMPVLPTPISEGELNDIAIKEFSANTTGTPVYSDPNGFYDYFASYNGLLLWLVPRDPSVEPIKWISGSNFIYIP